MKTSTLQIRVTPNAKKDEIAGEHGDALKIRLRAPAVEGKANKALIAFVAKKLGVPRNRIRIVGGDKSRNKRLEIDGVSDEELRRLA